MTHWSFKRLSRVDEADQKPPEAQGEAALHNSRAYFDDWTAARPSSEWPKRHASALSERAEIDQLTVELPLVPAPSPSETPHECGKVVHMANEAQPEADCRRRHKRVDGPFDGLRVGALETPVQLYDLSRGGCFINSMHQQQPGIKMQLKIDLPYEGWITVTAEALYRRGEFGFAVRFVDMSADSSTRLEKALQALAQRALHEA